MSIVPMKRLRLLGLTHEKDAVLSLLLTHGCVEVQDATQRLSDPDWAPLLRRDSERPVGSKPLMTTMNAAITAIMREAAVKKPLFSRRPEVSLGDFFSADKQARAQEIAEEIEQQNRTLSALQTERTRLQSRVTALSPWTDLDIPLETTTVGPCRVFLFVLPGNTDPQAARVALDAAAPTHALDAVGADNEQQYYYLLIHDTETEEALSALKPLGYSAVSFKELTGLARDNLAETKARLEAIEQESKNAHAAIAAFAPSLSALQMALDRLTTDLLREEAESRLLYAGSVFFLEGWVTASEWTKLQKDLQQHFDCAFDVSDPGEDEAPPVLLRNSRFIRPFNMVTNMYALPAYRNIDPNPLISVFYAVFFGMMYADVAYGLILIAISLVVTKKFKPRGMMGYMFPLMGYCGFTSAIWGFLFGGYFSDALDKVAQVFFGKPEGFVVIKPLWMNPMDQPMLILIVAIAIGVIHILFGMGVKAYLCIRDGRPLDALFDVGSWWLLFAGVAVLALGGPTWVLLAGFAALILTQGRRNKGILKKFMGGLLSLYDITAYMSDILSYSRLMALGLAGSVMGSVFNTMGSQMGSGVVGFLFFLVIFFVGHAFNMGINIIGTYVHAARLQYLEFFSKFYEVGGVAFNPLRVTTKYVDVAGVVPVEFRDAKKEAAMKQRA